MAKSARHPDCGEVTRMLSAARRGDADAAEDLFPLVYEELRRLARACMSRERREHTLQPTALVHEAYLELLGGDVEWESRAHFLGVAAKAMRRVLVDHAVARKRLKRGGDRARVVLDDAVGAVEGGPDLDVVALDEALDRLAAIDPEKARLVELRVFGGLSHEEVARVLESSERSVRRAWTFAKAWLRGELERGGGGDAHGA